VNVALTVRILLALRAAAEGALTGDFGPMAREVDGQSLELALRRPYLDRSDLNPNAWWLTHQVLLQLLHRTGDPEGWRKVARALLELVDRDIAILQPELVWHG
jgi:hypothetical protein